MNNLRIRKLTPKECWRLMGFDDEDFEKASFKKETSYIEGGLKCNAKLKIVNEKQRHLDMETYALCTTNDMLDMETPTQTKWKKSIENENNEKMQNVNIAIEMLDDMVQKECVANIIKCGQNITILYTLMEELDQHHMAIIELGKRGKVNIEKYMKITLEENLNPTKLYIISTLIEQIIKSKIYTCITQKANIQGNIVIIEDCVKNLKMMKLSNLKMEYITRLNSDSMLYKQAGNSIVVQCLEGIISNLNITEHLKVLELFGGIGACSKAIERQGIDYEIVDYVEIDKYACKSFNAIHGTNFEPQDITTWDKDVKVDLIMHGSPCQDFSLAGLQAGGDKDSGTRSSLMYETIRIVEKLKPKYVIWENVKNLLSKKHVHNFNAYLETMEQLGYTNYYQVLNAKDYGIPQSRERVFTVSILGNENYEFPPKQELKLRLKDMLEDEVDEKYYLSEKMINFFYKNEQIQKEKGNGFRFGVSDGNVIVKTITTRANDRMDDNFIDEVKRIGGVFDTEESKHQAGSVYDKNGLAPTLDTMQGGYRQPCVEINDDTFVSKKYDNFIDKNGYIPKMFNPYNEMEVKDIASTQTTCCNSTTSSATVLIAENKWDDLD